jgi:hypothetical protein
MTSPEPSRPRRAWPFEAHQDPEPAPASPAEFLVRHGEATEAVIVRIGSSGAQMVLVAASGKWDRWVYASTEDARAAAEELGAKVHVGAFPEEVRSRMNLYRPSDAEFARAPYPEQGEVGGVSPYPENRPRRDRPREPRPGS